MSRRCSSHRFWRLSLIALIGAAFALFASACGDDDDSSSDSGSGVDSNKPAVMIATQAFGESEIAGQIYGQILEANGYAVTYQSFDDRSAIYTAMESDDANFVPEYAATALEFLNGNAKEATPDIEVTMDAFQTQLESKGLVALEPSEAVDTNSFVVTEETATSKSLEKISDLTTDLKLGAPQDCPSNAACIPGLQSAYGLDFTATYVPLDASGPLTKEALTNGDIDVAVIFSTDASIAVNGWKVLEDDKGSILLADNIVPVVTQELADDSELVDLVNEASAALTTENVTEMNKRYDIDKEDADVIATDFLEEHDLL
ncbi:MAG TPA: ABC transporter substrate-binding protein [Microthrixaceae bacterium]|nr:ABC transporter substrate-binding protein [Microthrixaceae bacterium]